MTASVKVNVPRSVCDQGQSRQEEPEKVSRVAPILGECIDQEQGEKGQAEILRKGAEGRQNGCKGEPGVPFVVETVAPGLDGSDIEAKHRHLDHESGGGDEESRAHNEN